MPMILKEALLALLVPLSNTNRMHETNATILDLLM